MKTITGELRADLRSRIEHETPALRICTFDATCGVDQDRGPILRYGQGMSFPDRSTTGRFLDLLSIIAVTSAGYLLCYFVTFWIFYPLQTYIIPPSESAASLLFLPHGVRVLAAWLLGWLAVVALAPGALTGHLILRGEASLDLDLLIGMVIGIAVAPAVSQFLKWLGWDLSPDPDRMPSWTGVMTAAEVIRRPRAATPTPARRRR